jgi:hypothetical protein
MFEFLTGTGLAAAAGLNAYIPLLAIGLASRFLDFVNLPSGWAWLENEWVMVIIGVLLVIEIVADKIPAVDTINDWIQTIVRPASGGILFGAGTTSTTSVVEDPAAFFASNQWVPVVIGILLSLTVHIGKAAARPAANAVTFGMAAPVLSTVEDGVSVGFSALALFAPLFVIVGLIGLVVAMVLVIRRFWRRRREKTTDVVPAVPLAAGDAASG